MSHGYDIMGALQVVSTPTPEAITTSGARALIAHCAADMKAANDYDDDAYRIQNRQSLMRQLYNIDSTIAESGLRHLPKDAALILSNLVAECMKSCAIDEVVGGFDIASNQKKMNALRYPTVGMSFTLLTGGLTAIDGAVKGAKQPWYKSDLPGETARQNCAGNLHWHATELAKYTDHNVFYPNSDDLKKWVMQAFIEANAVEEGAAYIDAAWNQMWADIQEAAKQLPADIRQKVMSATGGLFEWVTGIPPWVAIGGVVLVGAGILYTGYKIITSEGGGRIIGGYLGGRR